MRASPRSRTCCGGRSGGRAGRGGRRAAPPPPNPGAWRLRPTAPTRQPAPASYLLAPGDDTYRAFKLDVLRVAEGRIAEITTFDAALFEQFGLPPTLSPSSS